MDRHEVTFWFSVGIVSIVAVALFKVLGAKEWMPEGVRSLAGAI
jgi:hypothetical protein